MVHIYTSASLLVILLEATSSAPAPFLLDLFAPRVSISRREGKKLSDGYGVPKDTYGAPEVSSAPSYEAPTTTTVAPCSYEAPTTTTTPAPSYGAPRDQHQPLFPDILGFIGGILKPKHQEPQSYGCLSAPVDSGYGVPQDTSYHAPESETYEAPETQSYEAPKTQSNEAPESQPYDAPESQSYDAPEPQSYDAPETPLLEAPVDVVVNERTNSVAE